MPLRLPQIVEAKPVGKSSKSFDRAEKPSTSAGKKKNPKDKVMLKDNGRSNAKKPDAKSVAKASVKPSNEKTPIKKLAKPETTKPTPSKTTKPGK